MIRRYVVKQSLGRKTFNIFNIFILSLFCLLIILPFMHIISLSLSSGDAISKQLVTIFPKDFLLGAYKTVIIDRLFLRSFINTVFLTVVTTALSMFVVILAAYSFSKEYFYGKKLINYLFVITMFFSGGLVPTYLLITRYLGWFNNYSALIFPALVSYFNILILRSQIQSIPGSLSDSAYIDGASEFKTAVFIIIPSIIPTIAALSMFTALAVWNQWFGILIYTDKKELWTLQFYLRAIVLEKTLYYSFLANVGGGQSTANPLVDTSILSSKNYEMAAIILVALPVVTIYPFIQKYFVKGILTGAVKE